MADLEPLVSELLTLDPALKGKEAQVRALASAMIQGRPDTGFRPGFKEELRARLDAQVARRMEPSAFSRLSAVLWPFLAGAAATAFVAVVFLRPDAAPAPSAKPLAAAGFSVIKREPGAFGPLAFLAPHKQEAPRAGLMAKGAPAPDSADLGGASALADAAEPAAVSAPAAPLSLEKSMTVAQAAADAGVMADAPAPSADPTVNAPSASAVVAGKLRAAVPAEPVAPRFVLSGSVELPAAPLPVYRRVPAAVSPAVVDSVAAALRSGGLPAVVPAELRSVTLAQPGPGGLAVTVDAAAGTVSAYRDWSRWPQCPPEGCKPLAAADLPSDAAVFAQAAATLDALGISVKNYGAPSVARPDLSSGYVPDTLQVAYPMMVAGLPVYDQWGVQRSLTLDVDVRALRVAAVNGADVGTWAASDYPVLPADEVAKAAAHGGLAYVAPDSSRAVDVPLGAPVRAYVAVIVREGPDSGEYLVPALVLPVAAAPEGVPVPPVVVVPLVDVNAKK